MDFVSIAKKAKEASLKVVDTSTELRNRALLKELIQYNSEGNFDRISAMGMLMLLREDRMIAYQGNISKEKEDEANSTYLGNDPFFKNNYDFRIKH